MDAFDSETEKLRFGEAYDQQDAIKKAVSLGVIPRKTDDVRPRIPRTTSNNTLMTPEKFQEFMDQLSE